MSKLSARRRRSKPSRSKPPCKRTALATAIAVASAGTTGPAAAQEAQEAQETLESFIEEWTVTVQRRAEGVQDVPLSVSVLTGDFVRETNLDDIKDIASYTPGMSGNSKDSYIDRIQIRGIYSVDFGVGGDPSISFFKNGMYQGRNGTVVTSLYDIDRVEVARGSQGFLFGRNSIGGAVSTHTRRPQIDSADGYVEIDIGQRGRRGIQGATNVTLSGSLAGRIAVYSSREDGYTEDVFDPGRDDLGAHDKRAGRVSLLWQSERFEANAIVEYEDRDQTGTVYRANPNGDTWPTLAELFDVELRGGDYDLDSDLTNGEADDGTILSLGIEIQAVLDWATFSSLTARRVHDYYYAEDFDGSPLRLNDYEQDQDGSYVEQEFRLVSEDDDPLSWYAGVSAYREVIDVLFTNSADEDTLCAYYYASYGFSNCAEYFAYYEDTFTPHPGGLVERNRAGGRYTGWAAYLDLNYQLTDRVDVGLGVRYATDTKRFMQEALAVESDLGPFLSLGFTTDGVLVDERSWEDISPRVVFRYRPNDDLMLFASATRGYKSGGFGSFAIEPDPEFGTTDITPADAKPDSFDAETAVSFEVGIKSAFADRRARVNVNAYSFAYEDLQLVVPGQGGVFLVENAGEVDGYGLEADLQILLGRYWDLFFSAAWAETEARDVQALCSAPDPNACEGNGLGVLPKFSYSAVLQAEYPTGTGQWYGRVELFGQSKTYSGIDLDPRFIVDPWTDTALRIGYRADSGWEVTAYVENILDERYFDGSDSDDGILPGTYFGPSPPRSIGLRLTWSFD